MSNLSLAELEHVFIEKLSEKYEIKERDIKKAFSRFDKDGNGLLDLSEMHGAFKLFLNGVRDEQIRELVSCYDINGDNKISYEEFIDLLRSRSASQTRIRPRPSSSSQPSRKQDHRMQGADRDRHNTRDRYDREGGAEEYLELSSDNLNRRSHSRPQAPASRASEGYEDPRRSQRDQIDRREERRRIDEDNRGQAHQRREAWGDEDSLSDRGNAAGRARAGRQVENVPSEADSEVDFSDVQELESRAQVFLFGLRGILNKMAKELRMEGKVRDRLTMSMSEMAEAAAHSIIDRAFQRHTGVGDGRARGQASSVGFPEFCKVMRTFKSPGGPTIRVEVLRYLFSLCSEGYENEEGDPVIDPSRLIPLVYGDERHTSGSGKWINNSASAPRQATEAVDSYGGPVVGGPGGVGGLLGKKIQRREAVGSGPMRIDGGVAATGGYEVAGAAKAGRETAASVTIDIVPLRFISRKSRTALTTPINFTAAQLKRSAQQPNFECQREHIHGISPDVMAGRLLHSMPLAPAAYTGARNAASRTAALSPCTLVYAAASVGVVHDLASNRQCFFDGHSDDISCIALAPGGQLAATGCVASAGKAPVVKVWDTAASALQSPSNGHVVTVGAGFFQRSVNAVAFAFDSTFVVAVSSDDQHMLGVWVLPLGQLVAQAPCMHGGPDMFKDLQWCPAQTFTEWVTREHSGACDVICTAGEHHLKLWSLRRPPALQAEVSSAASSLARTGTTADMSLELQTSLTFKSCVLPLDKSTASSSAPKVYTAVAFAALEDGSFDLISGGSNGAVHCWRKGVCVAAANAIRSGVLCLVVHGDRVYCGGNRGCIKVLDARTLAGIITFAVPGADISSGVTPRSSVGERPRSGSAVRRGGSQAGSVGGMARPGSASSTASASRPSSAVRGGGRPGSSYGVPASPVAAAAARFKGPPANTAGASEIELSNDDPTNRITGLTVVAAAGVGGSGAHVGARSIQVIATTGAGKAVRLDVSKVVAPGVTAGKVSSTMVNIEPVFYYHSGPLVGLAMEGSSSAIGSLVVTGGDDRRLCVWDSVERVLLTRTLTQASIRSLHMDKSGVFIAVGLSTGGLSLYALVSNGSRASSSFSMLLSEECFRKDGKDEISDIKFSPNCARLAAGCKDSCIYVYSCALIAGSSVLRPMHKLTGHSSHITHIDWSSDSALLQSTCGAYELLCWDAQQGKLFTTVSNSDVHWSTGSCVLGFNVMGIWPPCADGTDINAVDVSRDRGLVVTGDDSGFLNLLNYPCVVKNAPRKTYSGHSAHVMNVRLQERGGDCLSVATVGGRDCSLQLWTVGPASPSADQLSSSLKKKSYTTALY